VRQASAGPYWIPAVFLVRGPMDPMDPMELQRRSAAGGGRQTACSRCGCTHV